MPKMKPHTGMGKRVRVTGTGKLVHERSGMRHHLEVKSSRQTRRLAGTAEIAPTEAKRVRKMLGR
jgi:large subunit ribosomal protein L35